MRVIKRIKGKAEYFYLQHSFREDGQVVTREVYLGKTIPKNLDAVQDRLGRESREYVHGRLDQIKERFQQEWKRRPATVQEKELQEIAVAFTYNTNAIEGSTITLQETREILQEKRAPAKLLADVKETEAHAAVFLAMLRKKEKISNELLLAWHRDIFGGTKPDIAGTYRDYLVRVGSYVAPDWQEARKLMNALLSFLHASPLHPVERAAIVHYRFEKIHPFGDGNGRIGRLLMNHVLWYAGHPMLIIENKRKRSYYSALSKDEAAFTRYFIKRYLAAHRGREYHAPR